MNATRKLRTAAWLMTISLVLLVLFQAYWLQKNYNDEQRRLKRELGFILRDVSWREQMENFISKKKTLDVLVIPSDSLVKKTTFNKDSATGGVHVRIATRDTARRVSSVMTFDSDRQPPQEEDPNQLQISFPVAQGAIKNDSLQQALTKALKDAKIPLHFEFRLFPLDTNKFKGRRNDFFFRGMFNDKNNNGKKVEMQMLETNFEHPFWFLIKKMQWQLLFCVLMIAITTASFIFLYRNLQQQHKLAVIKNDFIANITHELKTPIATVGVAIEALKNFNAINDTQRTREYLDISGNELQRLNLLVDKVLKLSMFEQDRMEMQMEKVDLQQMLLEVMDSMRLQFEKNNAEIDFDVEGDNFVVKADRTHLQSVLYNLLDNALKYSPVNPIIKVALKELDNKIQMQVADNGIGIAAEYRQKVFEKFFRVPHGNTHNIKGYGLGLSYVWEVVSRHEGSIHVESAIGKGSTFTLELPSA